MRGPGLKLRCFRPSLSREREEQAARRPRVTANVGEHRALLSIARFLWLAPEALISKHDFAPSVRASRASERNDRRRGLCAPRRSVWNGHSREFDWFLWLAPEALLMQRKTRPSRTALRKLWD